MSEHEIKVENMEEDENENNDLDEEETVASDAQLISPHQHINHQSSSSLVDDEEDIPNNIHDGNHHNNNSAVPTIKKYKYRLDRVTNVKWTTEEDHLLKGIVEMHGPR